VDLLWYSFLLAYVLGVGAAVYFRRGDHPPRCRDCRTSAMVLWRRLAGSSTPVFEVVYRCPRCRKIFQKDFVRTVID
jgi:hypothetical protein